MLGFGFGFFWALLGLEGCLGESLTSDMRGLGGHQSDTMSPVKILNQIRGGMSSLCKEEPLGSRSRSDSGSDSGSASGDPLCKHARLAAQTFTIYTAMQQRDNRQGGVAVSLVYVCAPLSGVDRRPTTFAPHLLHTRPSPKSL